MRAITWHRFRSCVVNPAHPQVSGLLKRIKETAEQLNQVGRWRMILSAAFQQFLRGKLLGSTGRLAGTVG